VEGRCDGIREFEKQNNFRGIQYRVLSASGVAIKLNGDDGGWVDAALSVQRP
jgi:hypothetical protein